MCFRLQTISVSLWCSVLLLWTSCTSSEASTTSNRLASNFALVTVEGAQPPDSTSRGGHKGSSSLVNSQAFGSPLRRQLLQRSISSDTNDGGACNLTESQQRRFYTASSQTWNITDVVLEELDSDVQSIVACAGQGDTILLSTTRPIQPPRSIIISTSVTLSSQATGSLIRNGISVEVEKKARLHCPSSGDLLVIRRGSPLFTNLIFEDCNGTGNVVSIETHCDEDSSQDVVHFRHVEFRNLVLSGNHRILEAAPSRCAALLLENVVLRDSICGRRGCMSLTLNNTLRDVQITGNQEMETRIAAVSPSILVLPSGSETVATNASASENQLRLFNVLNSTFTLGESAIGGNRISGMNQGRVTLVGGVVILSNHSTLNLQDSVFVNNSGWNGASIHALTSSLNISNCTFRNNDAGVGDGGAIYVSNARSCIISSCLFSKNSAVNGAGVFANQDSIVSVLNTTFRRNNGTRGGAVYVTRSTLNVSNALFDGNRVVKLGSVIYLRRGVLSSIEVNISDNTAGDEGTLYIRNSSASLRKVLVRGNVVEDRGGGLRSFHSDISVSHSTFANNSGSEGGVLYSSGSSISVSHSRFEKNRARRDGGVLHSSDSNISVSLTQFEGSYASGHGGVMYFLKSSIIVQNSTFKENDARLNGGAMYSDRSNIHMSHSKFERNSATRSGHASYSLDSTWEASYAIYDGENARRGGVLFSSNSDIIVNFSSFETNSASQIGGVMCFADSSISVRHSRFKDNAASQHGGVMYSSNSNISMSRSSLERNYASWNGGAMYFSDSGIRVRHSMFKGSIARIFGGVMYSDRSKISVRHSKFENNSADSNGGVMYFLDSSITVGHSRFENNSADSNGGVMYFLDSIITVRHSRFENNSASWEGGPMVPYATSFGGVTLFRRQESRGFDCRGGAFEIRASTIKISDSLFHNNSVEGSGGGIHAYSSFVVLTRINFTSNIADDGGGCYFRRSNSVVEDVFFSQNRAINGSGGGVYGETLETMSLVEVHFQDNTGTFGGGGYFSNVSATMQSVNVSNNRAIDGSGGGVYATNGSRVTGTSIFLHSNVAAEDGGGITVEDGSSLLCNTCEIMSNVAKRGGGVAIHSDDSMLIVAQIQDSMFVNNSATQFGGGLLFKRPSDFNVNCNAYDVTCGHVALLSTTFVRNRAIVSGSAIVTTKYNSVLVSCNHSILQSGFMNENQLNSLKHSHPKRLCSLWTGNKLPIKARGDVVGTYGRFLNISTDDEEAHIIRDMQSRFVLESVQNGETLPIIQIFIVDEFGYGPAPTNPLSFLVDISSPDKLFQGVVTITIADGIGNLLDVVALKPPGRYNLSIIPRVPSIEEATLVVHVRDCLIGEEPVSRPVLCQACGNSAYNFDPTELNGCLSCPREATCRGRYIVPKDGYWHKGPCHAYVSKCIVDDACTYHNREEKLYRLGFNLTSCEFNKSMLMKYSEVLCREGYKGPLCGSCSAFYGLSMGFKCSKCPHALESVLTLVLFTLYLLAVASFTIRGGLPLKPKKSRVIALPDIDPSQMQTRAHLIEEAVNLEMVARPIRGRLTSRYLRLKGTPSTSSEPTPPSNQSNEVELTKWITSEIFKVMINFLQVTAVAASINVEWSEGILTMFEAAEYVGALSSNALSRPIDCIISSDSAMVRSIWRTLLTLFIPILIMGIFAILWGYIAIREKKSISFFWKRVILSIIAVTYISYLGLTKIAVKVFYCVDVYDSIDHFSNSQATYWAVDTSIVCYSNEHVRLIIIAVIVLFFMSLSFPLISIVYLSLNKVRCRQTDGWTDETMGFLYKAFKERYVFWESVVMFRKACLSVIVVFSYPLGGRLQGLLALGLLLFCLYLQMACSPYKETFHRLNYYESGSLLVSCLTFVLGQILDDDTCSNFTKSFVGLVAIVLNTSFFGFLLFAFVWSGMTHLRSLLKSEDFPIDDNTSSWVILKILIKSKMCSVNLPRT